MLAVRSEELYPLRGPVVDMSRAGALRLGQAYWEAVERTLRGVVRVRTSDEGVEIRLLRNGPLLLRLDTAAVAVVGASVVCSYEIRGGLLAFDAGGLLTLGQESTADGWRLRTAVTGFLPRLAARSGRPRWTGTLYGAQARLHAVVGRRFAACLVRGARG